MPSTIIQLPDYDALKIYRNRIGGIVKAAIVNNADCIILGAWGCGAFGQSPTLVAQAFAEVLNDYSGAFRKIVFAIRPTSGVGSDMTYDEFKRQLETYYSVGVVEDGV